MSSASNAGSKICKIWRVCNVLVADKNLASLNERLALFCFPLRVLIREFFKYFFVLNMLGGSASQWFGRSVPDELSLYRTV